MRDNYEPNPYMNPCEDCIHKMNPMKCQTCKHRNKQPLRPMYPSRTA